MFWSIFSSLLPFCICVLYNFGSFTLNLSQNKPGEKKKSKKLETQAPLCKYFKVLNEAYSYSGEKDFKSFIMDSVFIIVILCWLLIYPAGAWNSLCTLCAGRYLNASSSSRRIYLGHLRTECGWCLTVFINKSKYLCSPQCLVSCMLSKFSVLKVWKVRSSPSKKREVSVSLMYFIWLLTS